MKTIKFKKAKETKNTIKFDEQPEAGQPPVVGSLYLQKWFVGQASEVTVQVELK